MDEPLNTRGLFHEHEMYVPIRQTKGEEDAWLQLSATARTPAIAVSKATHSGWPLDKHLLLGVMVCKLTPDRVMTLDEVRQQDDAQVASEWKGRCIGDGSEGAGCGAVGRPGSTCDNCGGMILSPESLASLGEGT